LRLAKRGRDRSRTVDVLTGSGVHARWSQKPSRHTVPVSGL